MSWALLLAGALLISACGGGDSSDVDAYCRFVRDGVGVGDVTGSAPAEEFDVLLDVAPDEISDAVQQLRNTSRNLGEIDDVDQLFEAAFDPDAQAARSTFAAFAIETCGIDEDALPAGRVASVSELVADVRGYVDSNFGSEAWVPKVRYDISREDGALHDVQVKFVVPASADEPLQACNAVAVYLYELRDADGEVSVLDGGLTVVRREGPDDTCAET